jgi:large subunit ribosomal protein L25
MSSKKFTLNATLRANKGKGASRRLRRTEDLIPAILYGAGEAPTMISLPHGEIEKATAHEAFFSSILNMNLAGKPLQAIIKDMQRHPFKPRILHADFMRINANEKITMHIPLHFKGEQVAPGVKEDGGLVSKHFVELEVKCLPANLPEYIEIDISALKMEEGIHLSQVKLPKGVELAHPITDADHDQVIVNIYMPRAAEIEDTAAPVAAAEVETIVQGKADKEEAGKSEKK